MLDNKLLLSMNTANLTPMMKQYINIKSEHLDYLLFYRMGDFYELFFDDAIIASKELDIVLTKRGKIQDEEIPMCGVPVHSYEQYINKLIKANYKVAICEQVESPEEAKKRGYKSIVKRAVIRIITKGTIIEDNLLDSKKANFLASISFNKNEIFIAFADITTGSFFITRSIEDTLIEDLNRFNPSEIIISENVSEHKNIKDKLSEFNKITSIRSNSIFELSRNEQRVKKYFNTVSINSIGNYSSTQIIAIGSLIEYLEHTYKSSIPRLSIPQNLETSNFMFIDRAAKDSLELDKSIHGDRKNSLLHTIDHTVTSAGSRLLSTYLSMPLLSPEAINDRLDSLEYFKSNLEVTHLVRDELSAFPDVERALSKIYVRKATPRDLTIIRDGLKASLNISQKILFAGFNIPKLIKLNLNQISNFDPLLSLLLEALQIDVPQQLKEGYFIKPGFNPTLDSLYELKNNSQISIEKLRDKYRELTGINTLKISHNNVIGFYVEVTLSQAPKIKQDVFIHKQTLGNSARYKTIELDKLEADILSCDDKITGLESELFNILCNEVIKYAEPISLTSQAISFIDVSLALAVLAIEMNYSRPTIDNSNNLRIESGRHPVVELTLRNKFTTNTLNFTDGKNIWLITGPNMAGKSTFLRQNALICILAQIGSYVPAKYAHIGVIDKIFTRIGASDDISKGFSTFMIEMLETASILNNATQKSLVILDEIGRGTSTYDGLSIAWAIIENIHNQIQCRCLFATHYHELTNLDANLNKLECYTMNVKEFDGKVIFLHEIIKGKADKSYGIHVAELAGIPQSVIKRANQILNSLEKKDLICNPNKRADNENTLNQKKMDFIS
jgi:DNA mismatch repair protein MutS